MPPILRYLYDLTGKTLHLIMNRERCEGKTTVAIFWLEICNISTVSLRAVKFKIQTRYLANIRHTVYHRSPCGDIWLTVWIFVLEFCS